MQIGMRQDALDTRLIFRVYAGFAGVAGFLLAGWGQLWFGSHFPGQPWGKAAVVRMIGAIWMAAACAALGAAGVEDPPSRRRGLLWFAIGHSIIFVVAAVQNNSVWDSSMDWLVAWLFGVAVILFYLWQTTQGEAGNAGGPRTVSLFGSTEPPVNRLRSVYERQIRAAAAQEERNRLARDLHDSIKQQIFVMQTAAATAQARFDSDTEGARNAIRQIRAAAREAVSEMEAMLDQLRAAPLENVGLVEALRKQCEALGFRSGANVEFEVGTLPPNRAMTPGANQALFRAAQEALANVGRHARATEVHVALRTVGDSLQLVIRDNGAGFDSAHCPRGMGISNMRERVREFEGSFEVSSSPGAGTSILLSIPFAHEDAAEYAQQARVKAVLLAVLCFYGFWHPSVFIACVSVIPAIGLARSWRAYLQLREKGQKPA